jgi:hypothetical protein
MAKLVQAEDMTLPASEISAGARKTLSSIEWADCIRKERRGAGQIIRVTQPHTLKQYLDRQWPAWTETESPSSGPSRAESIRARRNSKSGAKIQRWPLHIRRSPDYAPTVHIMEDGQPSSLGLAGTVYLVENLEIWLYIEKIASRFPPGHWLYYAGFVSDRMKGFLAESGCLKIVMLPDYDPVGYNNFLSLRAALSPTIQVELYLPEQADQSTLKRYGNEKLWRDQKAYKAALEKLRAEPGKLSNFIEWQIELGMALEQEYLLIDV